MITVRLQGKSHCRFTYCKCSCKDCHYKIHCWYHSMDCHQGCL